MELELKITCTCHQEKIMLSNATGYPIAPKIYTGGFFDMLNPNFQSDLLSDHSIPAHFTCDIYSSIDVIYLYQSYTQRLWLCYLTHP